MWQGVLLYIPSAVLLVLLHASVILGVGVSFIVLVGWLNLEQVARPNLAVGQLGC